MGSHGSSAGGPFDQGQAGLYAEGDPEPRTLGYHRGGLEIRSDGLHSIFRFGECKFVRIP